MSGGERKKRGGDKGQGWEEAGAEFYQERYPMAIEADLQQALQDPSHIATLLPSKKSRVATTTAKRIRQEARTTLRRRTSTRSYCASTARRMSMNIHDAAVSMLPDLSENLSNEESTWEEIMQIKAMPVCMAQKLQLKKQLQNATKLRLQGFEQLKWQHRKICQQFRIKVKETYSKMELWSNSLKNIGGNFGTGIVAYFLFIKWLLFLNILIFSIVFSFLVLPTILLESAKRDVCNFNDTYSVACCSELYINSSKVQQSNGIIEFFQGTGPLEHTILFYGAYSHETFQSENGEFSYNMALAYVCAMSSIFGLSLVAIVRSAARGFREQVAESEGQFYQYCNLVFGGWDYCINNEKAATTKHRALFNELKLFLESERLEEERQNRTREEKLKLYSVRFFINLLILLVLCCCCTLLYYIIGFSFERINSRNDTLFEDLNYKNISNCTIIQTVFEFLPYVFIVCLNTIVPFLFRYLIAFEHYSPLFVDRVALFRVIFLRFTLLAILLCHLYKMILDNTSEEEKMKEEDCRVFEKKLFCWETFVGQQFFKFFLTDFASQFLSTFFINFPRSLIDYNTENRVLKFIGQQTFNLPKHVLDIVYLQAICWLGCFFMPFLPLIAAVSLFFLFYIKKFACLVNSTPSNQVYRASRSNSLFMLVLLVSYILTIIPVVYCIVRLTPSKYCGPFRGLETVWSLMIATFLRLPGGIQSLLTFLGTAGFAVPAFLILSLLLYYYYAVSAANKQMVSVLKNQLVLEGHDKQFLLNRLSAFIKQQQDQTKCHQETNELGTFT